MLGRIVPINKSINRTSAQIGGHASDRFAALLDQSRNAVLKIASYKEKNYVPLSLNK